MSDIDTALVDSLKVLDPKRPIREAGIGSQDPAQMPVCTENLNPNVAVMKPTATAVC